jgi:hypothetical protein
VDAIFSVYQTVLVKAKCAKTKQFQVSTKQKARKTDDSARILSERYKDDSSPYQGDKSFQTHKRTSAATIQSLPPGFCYVFHFKALANQHFKMARAEGLEPTAYGFGDRRSTN